MVPKSPTMTQLFSQEVNLQSDFFIISLTSSYLRYSFSPEPFLVKHLILVSGHVGESPAFRVFSPLPRYLQIHYSLQ